MYTTKIYTLEEWRKLLRHCEYNYHYLEECGNSNTEEEKFKFDSYGLIKLKGTWYLFFLTQLYNASRDISIRYYSVDLRDIIE